MDVNAEIGRNIREFREQQGWSQQQLAKRILLSQKQLSRVENGQIAVLDRNTLIRIADALETPVINGAINTWLHRAGYRPYVKPQLPLPLHYESLVVQFLPYPAVLLDIGWFMLCANSTWQSLNKVHLPSLKGLERNFLIQTLNPHGIFSFFLQPNVRDRILTHVAWQWEPYRDETWLVSLKAAFSNYLHTNFDATLSNAAIHDLRPIASVMDFIEVPHVSGNLKFHHMTIPVNRRPDLMVIVMIPTDNIGETWTFTKNGELRRHYVKMKRHHRT